MSRTTFNPPLAYSAPPGTKSFSEDGHWEVLTVPGGWLFTRVEYEWDDQTGSRNIPRTTTFVPFPS